MQPFNETRQTGIDILKAYYKKVVEVPEPQEYFATVANLPMRKDDVRHSIFHNTCVTISPNQLYTVHRLMATHKDKIIPKFHPLYFFLTKLGDPPANVERKDDKIFTMPLSGGEDDEVDEETKQEILVRTMCETIAQTFKYLDFPDDVTMTSNEQFVDFLKASKETISDEEGKELIEKGLDAIKALKKNQKANILTELDKYVLHRQGYRNSLKKEKEEMEKSLETLHSEAEESLAKEGMYKNYLDNIIKSAFLIKLQSKREYQEAKQIGPVEYKFADLEKMNCFTNSKELESAIRKNTVFQFTCNEPGRVEININLGNKESRTVTVGISALLDLLTQQDTAKIYAFVFDLRTFIAFLNNEVAG